MPSKSTTARKRGAKKVTDTAEATEAKRGRPRPQTVIDRDEAVLTAITKDGSTNAELQEATGLPKNEVYLSVFRLRRDGKIVASEADGEKTRSKRWVKATK